MKTNDKIICTMHGGHQTYFLAAPLSSFAPSFISHKQHENPHLYTHCKLNSSRTPNECALAQSIHWTQRFHNKFNRPSHNLYHHFLSYIHTTESVTPTRKKKKKFSTFVLNVYFHSGLCSLYFVCSVFSRCI